MLQFLPENLNIEEILEAYPPSFPYHKDSFIYILSLITEIPSRKSGLLDMERFIPLNAQLLKERVHNYKAYLNYLVEHSALECDNIYVPGHKSRGYRFTAKYLTAVQPVSITKPTLLKKLNGQSNYSRHMTAKYDYLYKWLNDDLIIDYEAAKAWLWARFQQDMKENKENPVMKYNARFATLMQLNERMHRFRVDRTSGRLHTLLTGLKKELRNYISYNGMKLVSVDIRCSQPTLSTILLDPEFYSTVHHKTDKVTVYRTGPSICKEVDIEELQAYVCDNKEKFTSYIEAVNGDLYTYIKERLQEAGHDIVSRKAAKDIVFTTLFSDNRFIGQQKAWPKRLFKELFPEVYQVFSMYKKHNSSNLSVLLQKLETSLVLDNAAKKLSKANRKMPMFTIHDSIIVPVGSEEICSEMLKKEAVRLLGININLNIEPWLP